MQVLIPMAGLGSRFSKIGITTPKPLIEVEGKTLIEHSIKSFNIDAEFIFITRDFENQEYNDQLSQLLKKLRPESKEIKLKTVTLGSSQTCLAAESYLKKNEPLVIYNCDQIIRWDPNSFLKFTTETDCDGAVVLFKSNDPKNSFADISSNGKISRFVEKEAISTDALIGFHYWKESINFINSAKELIDDFHKSGRPECYISETYNYLIRDNLSILPYFINNNMYIPLGTPEDVSVYSGKMKEFYSDKPKTIFCDIDGTILKHCHTISEVLTVEPQLLSMVQEKFCQWDSQGHKIILVTARKESTRTITEQHLSSLGLAWDQLIMGVTSGQRVLINDKLVVEDPDRAISVNLVTDQGFKDYYWKDIGL